MNLAGGDVGGSGVHLGHGVRLAPPLQRQLDQGHSDAQPDQADQAIHQCPHPEPGLRIDDQMLRIANGRPERGNSGQGEEGSFKAGRHGVKVTCAQEQSARPPVGHGPVRFLEAQSRHQAGLPASGGVRKYGLPG